MITITLIGAGGKMGCRITDHLKDHPGYTLRYVECSERGVAQLATRGVTPTPMEQAVPGADAVILAVPDKLLGKVSHQAAPLMKSGAMLITLDPAAAHAGELPAREDISIFVTHPCHPSVFEYEEDPEARADFFGGVKARMPIVCALMRGPEAHYALGEQMARDFFAPVTRAHRITVEQMALLEPAMAETVGIALIMALREALEEVVRRGVPRPAAEDFLYGHIKVPLGIAFNRVDFPFSDGAKLIAEYGQQRIFQPDWKKVFEPEDVRAQVRAIVEGQFKPQD
ncbi:MAG: NAD(P)-binding domain-containing protein [Verrucomicrobiae bacterium]|nr:NAD(P)-binding domain-containing protein [Verrucomicrobiae bacterium]